MKKLRMRFSTFMALVMIISLMTSCGMPSVGSSSGPDASQPTTASTTPSDPAVPKTDEPVVLEIMDNSDSSAVRREEFNRRFEAANPGVKIEYTVLTRDQMTNTVVNGIKSGDAPDIFSIPDGVKLPTAIKEGWLQSMEPFLSPNFKSTIEDYCFVDGITTYNGELYCISEIAPVVDTLFYYNMDILTEAGVATPPKSYDEFLDACRKVTAAGKGKYYGLIEGGKQLGRIESLVRALTMSAGGKIAPNGYALTDNGVAPYATSAVLGAFELINTLSKEGLIHPDTVNLNAPEARELFAQGQAAFLCQGMWCIAPWGKSYPDLNYGVMAVPTPDGSDKYGQSQPQVFSYFCLYKESKHPELAVKYLEAMFSEEFGYQSDCVADGNFVSIVKGINEKNIKNEIMKQYYDIAKKTSKTAPAANVRDVKVYDFYAAVNDVQPSMPVIAQGVMANSVKDYKAELEKLSNSTTAEWKRAAEASGLDYSIFEFPNWDPAKPYSQEDYSALK